MHHCPARVLYVESKENYVFHCRCGVYSLNFPSSALTVKEALECENGIHARVSTQ
jgi:hypothetical protein